ncbi:deoxyuridine 5'-triphosphate nucleotidohydrolase [Centipeda periodontii DSM 2778]|uniref:dUTP diphosphatase n=1 Tax=Centipeda periodontii DSM 2778 TaxID=888060 RepID=F5RLD0_9FIRM|nr:dUTP diphosphatase [Centipeda periodontii]EGK60685.1 deoxyuridine 5'-triphosphate nucleotidohydrolase [Centipeda periodontii DSM 2778]
MKTRGFEVVSMYGTAGIYLPERKTGASTGYDFAAAESVEIAPGEGALVPTGVKAYMQPDEVLLIYIRSSTALKKHLMLLNSVGVIDADYYGNAENEGHIYIPLYNYGKKPVCIAVGERIAQGIFTHYLTVDGDTAGRGGKRTGGFGSTGNL